MQVSINFKVDEQLKSDLVFFGKKERRSLSNYISNILSDHIENKKQDSTLKTIKQPKQRVSKPISDYPYKDMEFIIERKADKTITLKI